jgi:hypothetical protein
LHSIGGVKGFAADDERIGDGLLASHGVGERQ